MEENEEAKEHPARDQVRHQGLGLVYPGTEVGQNVVIMLDCAAGSSYKKVTEVEA